MAYDNTEVNFEIPQDSVLGQIIFFLYVNSNTKTFTNIHMTMYADDITILLKKKSLEDLEIDRFLKLTNLYQCLNNNNFHVDPTKMNCWIFEFQEFWVSFDCYEWICLATIKIEV